MNHKVNSNYKVVKISNYKLEFKHGLYTSEGFTLEDKDRDTNLVELLEYVKSSEEPDEDKDKFEIFRSKLVEEGYLRKVEEDRKVTVKEVDTFDGFDFSANHYIIYSGDSSLLGKINKNMYEEDQNWTAIWEGPRKVFVATFHPDETGCFNCLKERIESNGDYAEHEIGSVSGISEHLMETEEERFEEQKVSKTSGTLHSIDKENYVSSREKILRLPRCKICGGKNPSQTFIQTEDIE